MSDGTPFIRLMALLVLPYTLLVENQWEWRKRLYRWRVKRLGYECTICRADLRRVYTCGICNIHQGKKHAA